MRVKYKVLILKGQSYSRETGWLYSDKPLLAKDFSRMSEAVAFAKRYEQDTIPWIAFLQEEDGKSKWIASYPCQSVKDHYVLYKCWFWLSGRRRLYYIRKCEEDLDRFQLLSMGGRYDNRAIYICKTPEDMIRYLRK